MSEYSEIRTFVQATLGCACPEEVFDKIEYQNGSGDLWQKKINVGNRLLIYIATARNTPEMRHIIYEGLKQGVEERNRKGLNRFRLAVVVANPEEVRVLAEKAFESSEDADEKTHLHLMVPAI
jgi:hypothetical protein